jgi:hypothetical protein
MFKNGSRNLKKSKNEPKLEIFVYLYDFLLLISVVKAPSSTLNSDRVGK